MKSPTRVFALLCARPVIGVLDGVTGWCCVLAALSTTAIAGWTRVASELVSGLT
jgi:hypothetical protein